MAENEREAAYFAIEDWQLDILKELSGVIDRQRLVDRLGVVAPERDHEHFLSRLSRLDVIRFTDDGQAEPIDSASTFVPSLGEANTETRPRLAR